MTDTGQPAAAPFPDNVSALIVGVESYPLLGGNVGLPGAARGAAGFAHWLVERHLCDPARITLLTNYDEAVYREDNAALSPVDILASPALEKVNKPLFAKTAETFDNWIAGRHGPAPGDEFFYLFWVGHGLTSDNSIDSRICLLGPDAGKEQTRHVKLEQLLDVVDMIAPGVHEVGFVSACRQKVWQGYESGLRDGYHAIPAPSDTTGNRLPPRQSIVYATRDGEGTKSGGFTYQRFADVVLAELDKVAPGLGPADFVDELVGAWDHPLWRDFRMEALTDSPTRGRRRHLIPGPVDAWELARSEWESLLAVARDIDKAAQKNADRRRAVADLCWAAYCKAIGLTAVFAADTDPDRVRRRLTGFEELCEELCLKPAAGRNSAPPLVIACDFAAAQLSRSKPLDRWCAEWGDPGWTTDRDLKRYRQRSLGDARACREHRFPVRECLSVLVDDQPPGRAKEAGRYEISGFLWAVGDSVRFPEAELVTADQIADAVVGLVDRVARLGVVPDLDMLLVELILPLELLGRRFEYEGGRALGRIYSVVFRDLERLRHGREGAASALGKKLTEIRKYRRGINRSWRDKLHLVWCEELGIELGVTYFERWLTADGKFAFVLEHGSRGEPPGEEPWAAPEELKNALDAGAPVVISLNRVSECDRCQLRIKKSPQVGKLDCIPRESAFEHELALRARREDELLGSVDDKQWKNGLRDLPFILRRLRIDHWHDILDPAKVKIGVLMADNDRMFDEYFSLATGVREQ